MFQPFSVSFPSLKEEMINVTPQHTQLLDSCPCADSEHFSHLVCGIYLNVCVSPTHPRNSWIWARYSVVLLSLYPPIDLIRTGHIGLDPSKTDPSRTHIQASPDNHLCLRLSSYKLELLLLPLLESINLLEPLTGLR